MRDPKGDHGTLTIERGQDWHIDMHYDLLETGGFLRLCTLRGRTYWHAQNTLGHMSPDWKIHFSVVNSDLPKAWNILSELFVLSRCDIGMKVTTIPDGFDGENGQRGREITVYIYKYESEYGFGPMYDEKADGTVHFMGERREEESFYYLGREFDGIPYDSKFWFDFITKAENRLKEEGVRSNGLANGDLSLPGCRYASLRNEAFVIVKKGDHLPHYPPNSFGWNAAKHPNPLEETMKMLRAVQNPTIHFLEQNLIRGTALLILVGGFIVLNMGAVGSTGVH
eukprot:TRINITY_DN6242_c0_g1_i1.p1 TRINITY_DN6242_c0_g1~~TRINITY_DN6242_c0_g1_i1.p1  ORF type:complete len:315 (+),score=72.10 TRINITY_DN6242_c0_g1_i1:100-945(+)